MAGHVDRAAPRGLDRDVAERGEHALQVLGAPRGSSARRTRTPARSCARGPAACRRCRTRSARPASCAGSGARRGSPRCPPRRSSRSPRACPAPPPSARCSCRAPSRVRRKRFHAAAHALSARTAAPARTLPPGVSAVEGRPAPNRVTGVCSKIRTPRSSSTRRMPRARRAGCTVAPSRSIRRRRGTWGSRRPPSPPPPSGRGSARPAPSRRGRDPRSPATRRRSPALVTTPRSPASRNHASTSFADAERPDAGRPRACRRRTEREGRPRRRSARASSPTPLHHPFTNPPLRPLGPPPQMSCSSSTTSQSGLAAR